MGVWGYGLFRSAKEFKGSVRPRLSPATPTPSHLNLSPPLRRWWHLLGVPYMLQEVAKHQYAGH